MEKKLPSRIKKKRNIKIKKSTIGIFAAIFAFMFSMFYAFAGETPKVSITSIDSATAGQTYTLDLSLENNKEYSFLGFIVNFDPEKLEFVSSGSKIYGASGDDDEAPDFDFTYMDKSKASEGQIMFSYSFASSDVTANTDAALGKVKLKVKDGVSGKVDVTIGNLRMALLNDDETETPIEIEKEDGYITVAVPVDMDSVALEEDEIEMAKGSTKNIVVTYEPENTTTAMELTCSSSDASIVSVDDDCVMTANAAGHATITVTAFGKELSAEVDVTNHITAVELSATKTEIEKGEQITITSQITPDDTSDAKTLTWASSNENAATVDQNGKVTGVGGGTTTITAESVNGKVGSIEINVVVPITAFTTTDTNLTLEKGENHTIAYTITPNDTTEDTTITWESTNTSVASVTNGVVTAIGGGNAVITGKIGDDWTITTNVSVVVPLESIALDKDTLDLLPEQNYTLQLAINPEDTTDNTTATWESNNPEVATVANGVVTGVAPGDATITVTVGEKTDTVAVHVLIPIDEFVISESEVTLNRGGTKQLTVTITPNNTEENTTVTWSSSDPTSVSVAQDGTITGLKGTQTPVTITGTLENGRTVTCTVTVEVQLDDFSLSATEMTMNKTATETLTVTLDPEDTSEDTTVTWVSSDDDVATVDSTGKVTAVGAGTATISATINAKKGAITKNCAVTVVVPLESIEINSSNFDLNRGSTKTLEVTINPSDYTGNKTVTWTSNKESVATVDSTGKVTAIGAGTATITAKVGDKTDTVDVTVVVPITSFTTTDEEFTLVKGKTKTISTTINPDDTTEDTTITWTSGNSGIATVDENGKVTGVSAGTTTITGKLANNMTVTSSVTVTIIPVESIEITGEGVSEDAVSVPRKDTVDLNVTYSPEDATEVTDVTWTSSDEDVATVDENGVLTGVNGGTATITASMGGKTDTITVTVTEVHLGGVSLDNNKTETEVGKDYVIRPTLQPVDGETGSVTDDVTYTYESSDPEIATVDETGKLITKKTGKVTITVKASNGVDEFEDTIEITVKAPKSPNTGVTPIWVYSGILVILAIIGVVIYKKKDLI